MKQSRKMSMVESIANVTIGYVVAVLTQVLIFPFFGLYVKLSDNLLMGGVFTIVSIVRSFTIRRVFERVRVGVSWRCPQHFSRHRKRALK